MVYSILRANSAIINSLSSPNFFVPSRKLSSQACHDLCYTLTIDPVHRDQVGNLAQSSRVIALYRDLYRTLRLLWKPRGQSRRLPSADILLPLAQLRLKAGFFRYQALSDERKVDLRCAKAHVNYLVPLKNIVSLNSAFSTHKKSSSSVTSNPSSLNTNLTQRKWVPRPPTSNKYHNDLQNFLHDLLVDSESVLRQQVRSLIANGSLTTKSSIFRELIPKQKKFSLNNTKGFNSTTPELINALVNCEVPYLPSFQEHNAYLNNKPDFINTLPFHQRFFNQYRNRLDHLGLVKFPKRAQIAAGARLAVPPHITGRPLPEARTRNIILSYWDLVRISVLRSGIVPVTRDSLIVKFDLQNLDTGNQDICAAEERRFWNRLLASVKARVVIIEVVEAKESETNFNNKTKILQLKVSPV
ncbi:hypothetical protein NADFUDRAFT_46469 [Nadsonia fulvescens var. elongata DSM 6958]|uniref:Uncharacterized protein n=1 Tax=Nadsonia fulvescens var. elongata DSM 6958 TaxID=857566 RepID=A0A1E3PKA7_9ASCO|nr:hypothetical protein NADFUDRAFT_46469 [Nadsonia fulvescens var. elongata DSM 6958]